MGASVYANLSYGIFIDCTELPWFDDKYDDIEDWWLDVNNFTNPIPIKIVKIGDYDYPLVILTTKTMRAFWGELQDVDPDFFNDLQESHNKLIDFLDKYGIITDQQPRWILSSYMS